MAKRQTNTQFIKRAMEYSKYGAMAQMIIMHAITAYVNAVAECDDKPDDWNDFVVWETWHACCVDIKQQIEKFYRG